MVTTAVSSAKVAVVLSAVVSYLCKVGREVGPTHCPMACQIDAGEGMYIPLCILAEIIYFPGMILGFCVYCLEKVFLFCILVLHATLYRKFDV